MVHVSVFSELHHVQKRATKSDTWGHCLGQGGGGVAGRVGLGGGEEGKGQLQIIHTAEKGVLQLRQIPAE